MTEEEKKALEDAKAAADDATKALEEAKTAHATELAAKDAIIEQKTRDIVGARKETQELKALTDAEKAAMSDKEIELHNATLALQERQEAFEKTQQDSLQKEVGARRTAAIKKIAGDDAELAAKIEANLAKIVDSDKAQTEDEISGIVSSAFNMLGTPAPDPVHGAMGGAPGNAPFGSETNYAESSAGKELANLMGIQVETPKA